MGHKTTKGAIKGLNTFGAVVSKELTKVIMIWSIMEQLDKRFWIKITLWIFM